MRKSKRNKGEVIEAEYRMVEEEVPRRRRPLRGIFATGLITATFSLFMFGLQIGREFEKMPHTEYEVLAQSFVEQEARVEQIRKDERRDRANTVLKRLGQLWSNIK